MKNSIRIRYSKHHTMRDSNNKGMVMVIKIKMIPMMMVVKKKIMVKRKAMKKMKKMKKMKINQLSS